MKRTRRLFRHISLKSLVPQLIVDAASVVLGYWLGFFLRYNGLIFQDSYDKESYLFWIPWLVLLYLGAFFIARFYNTRWEYCSVDEIIQIFFGVTGAAVVCTLLVHNLSGPVFGIRRFP